MKVISEHVGLVSHDAPRLSVSVVLCTWNGGPWIQAFLDTITTQNLVPDELVVQDDASSDDTVAKIERFAADAPFPVRLEVNDHQIGSTRNFELALARATCDVVALADQDDLWYPTKLARLVGVLAEDPILTLAFSDADLVDPDGTPTGGRLWSSRGIRHLLTKHEIVPGPLFARRALTTGCTMVARRRAVDAALPFPASLDDPVAPMRHDRWLSLVAAAVGTVRAIPEPLLGFRVHPAQQTGVLDGHELRRRLVGAALDAASTHDPERVIEHQVRACQIAEAARRADQLGDFAEADQLRRIVKHHEVRADLGRTRRERVGRVWHEITDGGYDRSALGAAASAADLVRAVGQRHPDPAS